MDPTWPPPKRPAGGRLKGSPTLFAAVAITTLCLALLHQWQVNRGLTAEVGRARGRERAALQRERELEASLARQHARLVKLDADQEMLRAQLDAVDLQLDGVDYLSAQLRAELGAQASAGTWADVPVEWPLFGDYTPGGEVQRATQTRRRLATGLRDLQELLVVARQLVRPEDAAAESAPAASQPPLLWPVQGQVTSGFGWRLFRGLPNFHGGIDLSVAYGTPIAATADGTVLGAGWQPGYGWSVLVQHDDGYATLYAHMSRLLVETGDTVGAGGIVGLAGSSGNSTGPHLHYEIWKDGQPQDPRPFMDGRGAG